LITYQDLKYDNLIAVSQEQSAFAVNSRFPYLDGKHALTVLVDHARHRHIVLGGGGTIVQTLDFSFREVKGVDTKWGDHKTDYLNTGGPKDRDWMAWDTQDMAVALKGPKTFATGTTFTIEMAGEGQMSSDGRLCWDRYKASRTDQVSACDQDTWENVITGAGGLHKRGNGRLILSQVNTFLGEARVDGGALHIPHSASLHSSNVVRIMDGGRLEGEGTVGNVVVEEGGILVPGPVSGQRVRKLTLEGDLTLNAGSIFRVNAGAQNNVGVKVKGDIDINAMSTVTLNPLVGSNLRLAEYTIVDFDGSRTGMFSDNVRESIPLVRATLTYESGAVKLSFAADIPAMVKPMQPDPEPKTQPDPEPNTQPDPEPNTQPDPEPNTQAPDPVPDASVEPEQPGQFIYADAEPSRNSMSLLSALVSIAYNNDIDPLYAKIIMLPDVESVEEALDELPGEVYASTQPMAMAGSAELRGATSGQLRTAFNMVGSEQQPGPDGARWSLAEEKVQSEGMAMWSKVLFAKGSNKGNERQDTLPIDYEGRGVLIGGDGSLYKQWRLGAFGGYSDVEFKRTGLEGNDKSVHVGLYTGRRWDGLALRTGVSYTRHDIKVERVIPHLSSLSSSYNAHSSAAFVELGNQFEFGESFSFEPFVGLSHIHHFAEAFVETSADGEFKLNAQKNTAPFSTAEAGVHGFSEFRIGGSRIRARGMLLWSFVLDSEDSKIVQRLGDSYQFDVHGTSVLEDRVEMSLGFDMRLGAASELRFNYTDNSVLGTANNRHRTVDAQFSLNF
ncbi:MAG: autotransporter domain-containing protein, partial [Betaproteobacteria bacterium]|nr:autotransporter domain-containing protein [Betaproteobacteria bacterium]